MDLDTNSLEHSELLQRVVQVRSRLLMALHHPMDLQQQWLPTRLASVPDAEPQEHFRHDE
jgi:hypothetical protein